MEHLVNTGLFKYCILFIIFYHGHLVLNPFLWSSQEMRLINITSAESRYVEKVFIFFSINWRTSIVLLFQALTLTTNSQSVRRDVRGAGQRMANILAEVSALKNQSEGLYVRSVTASQNAVAAEQLGNLCFKNASIMLDIMRDFASRAAGRFVSV